MWYLISLENPDVKHVLLGGKAFIVGRRDCEILITGDATVSRRHAELSVSHTESNLTNPDRLPILMLKDLSKFGTWANKEKVSSEKILKDGDTIIFGSPKSQFTVVYEPFVITTSCLDPAAKKMVRAQLCILGGHMINDWKSDCSLLVMTKITVTIKVICALVSLKPIVSPKYLEAYANYLGGQSAEKPDTDDFVPEIAESQVDPHEASFASNSKRKTLFQGMTFVFLSPKQHKKMSLAVELAGGMTLVMEKSGEIDLLKQVGTVVMSCPASDLTPEGQKWLTKVQGVLKRCGRHMIQDAEIGYAVLYCSTEKHCNPDSSDTTTSSQGLPGVVSQSLTQADICVPDSETQSRYEPPSSRTRTGRSSPGPSGNKSPVPTSPVRGSRSRKLSPVSRSHKLSPTSRSPEKTESQKNDKRDRSPIIPFAGSVQVKQEPKSQPSKPSNRKRGRFVINDEDEDEDVEMEEEIPFGKRVKKEEITPQKLPPSRVDRVVEPELNIKSEPRVDSRKETTTRKKARTPSPVRSSTSPIKISQNVSPKTSPKRKQRKTGRAEREDKMLSDNEDESEVNVVPISENTQGRLKTETEESYNPGSSRRREIKERGTELNIGEDREMETDVKVVIRKQGDVPSGYLSTRIPIKYQNVRKVEADVEADQPVSCMTVDVVSLVVRHIPAVKNKAGREKSCPQGFTRWKGKLVKNFKKFLTVENQGAGGLPRIIGGSDLVVNEGQRSSEMDDWFKDALQAESQHASEDRRAQELFDWDHTSSKRKGH